MTTTDAHGRYTEAAMTQAMRHIADRLDVPSHDARLFRLTNNAVFALPTAAIVVRITRSTTLHDRVHKVARLATWFAERNAPTIRLAVHVDRSQDSLVHGDAHVGFLLRTPNGDVVIGDFDPTCTAPWQVDLVPAVGETRFGRHGAHARLALAYGYDVTQDPDWPTLREARELTMVCAAEGGDQRGALSMGNCTSVSSSAGLTV